MPRGKRRSDRNGAVDRALRAERRETASRDLCVLCVAGGLRTPAGVEMELHHLFGRNHDQAATVPLCRPHHRAITEAIRDAGADMRVQGTVLETQIQELRALGTLLQLAGNGLLTRAELLRAESLRRESPDHA